MTLGMAMLSTGGGSSTLALTLGAEMGKRGRTVRYCHCDPEPPRPLPGAFFLSAEPAMETGRLLDADRAVVGGIDAASQIVAWHDAAPFALLHLHSLQAFGVPALLLHRLRGVPYVVTLHGSDVLSEHLMDRNRDLVRALLEAAAAVTCVSTHLAEELERKLPGLPPAKVVHNFLPPELLVAARAGGEAERVPWRFLHVSSLRPVKRPELLLAAFAQVRARHPEARLALVSTARGLERAAALLPRYGLVGAVDLELGDDPAALAREYRRAAAFVLTSRFESFGLVILEAVAHGLAPVVPAVGGIPEVVGETWPFLVREPDDPERYAEAMVAAAATGAAAIAGHGPAILARFEPVVQAGKYFAVYERALARSLSAP
jgi:glycosyltransferase involved in cell wall biosynthesis